MFLNCLWKIGINLFVGFNSIPFWEKHSNNEKKFTRTFLKGSSNTYENSGYLLSVLACNCGLWPHYMLGPPSVGSGHKII